MKNRTIKSYVLRQGRLTSRQQQALVNGLPKWGLEYTGELFNWVEVFQRDAPLVLEIGFGMGQSLATMAMAHPEINYLGIEVHRPGVGALLASIQETHLTNVRVMIADATEVLTQAIPDHSLAGIQIFFPDPWPKWRHHKRRLIQAPLVQLVAQKLMIGGYLHLATDWEPYALHMLQVLQANTTLVNVAPDNAFLPREQALRPATKFEQRGKQLGHGVWDLLFKRV